MSARIVYRSPTGLVVWQLSAGSFVMWSPGGRLLFSLASPLVAGSPRPTPIAYPGSDGNYATLRLASVAVRRFAAGRASSGSYLRTRSRCSRCGDRLRPTRTRTRAA